MFKVGEWVLVVIPPFDQTGDIVRRFNGRSFRVKKRFSYRTTCKHYYTLEGCKSDKGIDYNFMDDWLMRS